MRQLNLGEAIDKLQEYSDDIRYCEWDKLHLKLQHLWNFINEQNVLANLISRIEKDYSEHLIEAKKILDNPIPESEILNSITTRDRLGIYGLASIMKAVEEERKEAEVNIIEDLNRPRESLYDTKEDFVDLLFNPFIDLMEWYYTDKRSDSIQDYFTLSEAGETNEKIEEAFTILGFGQEVLFNEIDELKELVQTLTKKNWIQLLKMKLYDLVSENLITWEVATIVFNKILGEDLPSLTQGN